MAWGFSIFFFWRETYLNRKFTLSALLLLSSILLFSILLLHLVNFQVLLWSIYVQECHLNTRGSQIIIIDVSSTDYRASGFVRHLVFKDFNMLILQKHNYRKSVTCKKENLFLLAHMLGMKTTKYSDADSSSSWICSKQISPKKRRKYIFKQSAQ